MPVSFSFSPVIDSRFLIHYRLVLKNILTNSLSFFSQWWMCVRIDLGYLEHLLVTNSTIEDLDFIFESVRKSRLEHLAMKKEIICSLWTKLSSTLTEASESVVDERPDPQAPLSEEDILQMRLCSHEESIVHNLIRVEARAAQGQVGASSNLTF